MDGDSLMNEEYRRWRAETNARRFEMLEKKREMARRQANALLTDARAKLVDATDPDEVAKLDAVIVQQTAILNELN